VLAGGAGRQTSRIELAVEQRAMKAAVLKGTEIEHKAKGWRWVGDGCLLWYFSA
jgi:hypothetical protein